jgi:sugar phosphate isomerase/epimerase
VTAESQTSDLEVAPAGVGTPAEGQPATALNLGVCQLMLPDTSFEDDVRHIAAAGIPALGIWEGKLIEGEESVQAKLIATAGLAASAAIPANISPLPADDAYPGPADLDDRVEAMKHSIRRLARFRPSAIVVLTGSGAGLAPADARRVVIDGLREAAREAAWHELALSIEPIPPHPDVDISMVHTIPEVVELIDEIGAANVGICWDACNLAHTEDVVNLTQRYASLINSVHLADLRAPRGPVDRHLPGDGYLDLSGMLSALRRGGYAGTVDLEVLARDGLDFDGPAALWRLPPPELISRAQAATQALWAGTHPTNGH